MGKSLEELTDESLKMRIRLYESYFKSIMTLTLGVGIGIFLILIFSAIMSGYNSYNLSGAFFLIYIALIEILSLFSIIRIQYKRYIRRMNELLKNMNIKER